VNAARALAIADTVGHIAAGMSADLVAVSGDPLRDIRALRDVRFVLSRGHVALDPPK